METPDSADWTVLTQGAHFSARRHGRYLVAELLGPHLALSTSLIGGGQSDSVRFLLNHQSCEGAGHREAMEELHAMGRAAHHDHICRAAGLDPARTALMGTAANMQYAAVSEERFEDLAVVAIVTAGVQGNAGRAGDPAHWHENGENWRRIAATSGTINTLLLIGWPLLPPALARAVVTMTEAKSAALDELAVGSRASLGRATGTGTDQFAAACPLDARRPLAHSGKHVKLGELIGRSVLAATKEALRWQNGLEPSSTRSLTHALGRFGLSEERLREGLARRLPEAKNELALKNWKSILYEPQVAACAYAMAEVADRARYGTLPAGATGEALRHQAALLAAVLAARPAEFAAFSARLPSGHDLVELIIEAVALGWAEKWPSRGQG